MSGLYRYGGEGSVTDAMRGVERQLSLPQATVFSSQNGARIDAEDGVFLLVVESYVEVPGVRCEAVRLTVNEEIPSGRNDYWTFEPFRIDESRVLRSLGDPVTTRTRKLTALSVVEWQDETVPLPVGSGIAIRCTPTGSPSGAFVVGSAKLRRGY